MKVVIIINGEPHKLRNVRRNSNNVEMMTLMVLPGDGMYDIVAAQVDEELEADVGQQGAPPPLLEHTRLVRGLVRLRRT